MILPITIRLEKITSGSGEDKKFDGYEANQGIKTDI